jgi:long-subunit acyl-CoA synthetase (AMP-forming)
VTDYACALKGIPVVLMHRSSNAEQLASIIQRTHMRVLVVSIHLKTVVQA